MLSFEAYQALTRSTEDLVTRNEVDLVRCGASVINPWTGRTVRADRLVLSQLAGWRRAAVPDVGRQLLDAPAKNAATSSAKPGKRGVVRRSPGLYRDGLP